MSDKLLGLRLGRYEPLATLGQGGMARVYRARDYTTGREIALKVLFTTAQQDADLAERFRREAHTLASLHHPSIVQVYDYGEQDGVLFIAQQLLPGPPLDRELASLYAQGRHIERDGLLQAVDQLAAALDYAHARGVIHRDLKPANCIRNGQGDLVLTDFGIAKALSADTGQTRTGMILGTPAYLAPEQAQGTANLTPAIDIYALGVMLFEMLTGRVPFDADQPMAVLLAHVQQMPPSPLTLRPDLPPSVAQVVLRALAKDPAARYPRAGALAQALRQAWTTLPRPAAPPPDIHNQQTRAYTPPAPVRPATPPPAPPHEQSTRAAPGPAPRPQPQPTNAPATPRPRPTNPRLPPAPVAGGRPARSPLLAIMAALLVLALLSYGIFALLGSLAAESSAPPAIVEIPTTVVEPTTPIIATSIPTDTPPPTAAPTATPEPEVQPQPLPTVEAPQPQDPTIAIENQPTVAPPPVEPTATVALPTEPPPVEPPPVEPPAQTDFAAARAQVQQMRELIDDSEDDNNGIDEDVAEELLEDLDELDQELEQGDRAAAARAAKRVRDRVSREKGDNIPDGLALRLLEMLKTLPL